VFAVAPLLIGAAAACSSSGGGDARDGGTTADDPDRATPAEGEASASDVLAEAGQDAAAAAVEAAPSDGATIPVADASAACVSFCSCMATNCASEVFAGGCLYQCTIQTNWDLPCRANMCSLVQAQPNNDHCTHAFGQVQCLDE
jgi:hypothetical protein